MSKFLKWLDDHILEYLSLALLIFIPLYPKIPLVDILPGYLVWLRLDDLVVAAAFGIWLIWFLRKKVTLKGNIILIPLLIYFLIGLISSISALLVTKTVPLEPIHISKLGLHFLRRIEYASVFFVFFSSLKSLGQIKKYVFVIAIVLLAVSIYGFGQKYLYWPAFSTMNKEFSKGITLYLSEHARVLSTFGGHYDLAAYLMLLLTIFIPLGFIVKNIYQKTLLFLTSVSGFWLLILTVSRTSFLAYMVSISTVFFLLMFKKGIFWTVPRYIVVMVISLGIMLSFGDLSSRFAHVLKLDQVKQSAFKPIKKEAPSGAKTAFLEEVGSKSDIPPSKEKPRETPADVQDQPDYINSPEGTAVAIPRVYSQAAVQYDLSTGIRLDYTWPQAIKGFTMNPLLGSGYSTLTKNRIEIFTEAESTDNDFLRALGETGILGFLAFYGMIAFIIFYATKSFKKIKDNFYAALVAAIIAAIIGLLVNAVYIDVFEASKVAYVFWILVAILLATVKLSQSTLKRSEKS